MDKQIPMQPASTVILIIDDDRASLLLLEYLFKSVGLGECVETALGSHLGLRILEERHRETHLVPALVILDVEMPEIDGFGVLTWIREKFPKGGPTTIMMSGSQAQHHVRRASELKADGYFVKFPSGSELKCIVELAHRISSGDQSAREELKRSGGSLPLVF